MAFLLERFSLRNSFLYLLAMVSQLFTEHRSCLSSKVSLVTRYTRNLIISVRWQLSSGDFPGRRIGKMRPLLPHFPPSFPLPRRRKFRRHFPDRFPPSRHFPSPASLFFFSLFFSILAGKCICVLERAAPFISRLCRRSTYTLLSASPPPPLFVSPPDPSCGCLSV